MRAVHRSLASAAALALALLVAAPVAPAAAQATAAPAGGFADARGVIVNLTMLTAVQVPGALGSTQLDPNTFSTASQSCPVQVPEPKTDELLNVNAAPAATVNTMNTVAGARCDVPTAVASAQMTGVTALVNAGKPIITADLIRAQANSDCRTAPNATGTLFAGLTVNGNPIGDTPKPNTTITIPGVGLTVIVNEQRPSRDGRGIVVNGIHVIGNGPLMRGDLVISHAVSGVVCPNGPGFQVAEGLKTPDITFAKKATPSVARSGDTVTYTATVTNASDAPCSVITFLDHLSPGFELVSTSGAFGKDPVAAPARSDGGQEVVLRPTGLTIEPKKSVTQEIIVRLGSDVRPGTYYNNLEIFCAVNGNFASGPLAPVTVPAAAEAPEAQVPAAEQLPRTGGAPLLAVIALVLVAAGLGARRLRR